MRFAPRTKRGQGGAAPAKAPALLFVLGALALGLPSGARGLEIPSPTTEFFVNDFAGALGEGVKAEILAKGAALEKASGAQAVVVVVDSLEGASRDDFSLELLRTWGIGQREENNGALLFVALGDREVKIEVGYGLEGALPDGKCGRILDERFVPAMREGKTDEAVLTTYDALLTEIAREYGLAPKDITEGTGYSIAAEKKDIIPVIFFITFFSTIAASAILTRRNAAKRKPGGGSGTSTGSSNYSGGPRITGFRNNGGSSGSSDNSSGSSGTSGGGSGGGGSGGGGGAGRSW